MFKFTMIALTVLLAASSAHAQFQIDWFTIDGGGGASTGGAFSLTGTIGQPDAGKAAGAPFDADCGFWGGAIPTCRADYDGNGAIEPADVSLFVSVWFTSLQLGTLGGDFDGNSAVEPADVSLFVSRWFAAITSGVC